MKTPVYFYWTNFLQPEQEPRLYAEGYKFTDPPEGWVLVHSAEFEVQLPPRESLAAEAVRALDKGIKQVKEEFYEKVAILEAQKNKFLALTM